MEMMLGKYELTTPKTAPKRISMLLWGSSGSGKTTLAATAPGKKLWILMDDGGADVLGYRDDIILMDISTKPDNIVETYKKAESGACREIRNFLMENEDVETVVFDSVTAFGEKALSHGVVKAAGTSKGAGATLEDPGYGGYGNKNTWTQLLVRNLLQVTGQLNRHVIFICHEDKPTTDSKGVILFISIMLGSSLNEQVPYKLSEVWNLHDTGKERRIAVRACRARKPMKSRMFITSKRPEFDWTYNADEDSGPGIADWYREWVKADGNKIELPE